MSTLRSLNASIEHNSQVRDFVVVCRALAMGEGDAIAAVGAATRLAGAGHASQTPASVLRAAVAAGSLSDPTWASPISPYGQAISAFLRSLRNVGAFDTMLAGGMRQIPLRTRVAAATSGAIGTWVNAGAAKPLSRLTLSGGTLEEQKATAIIAVSKELLAGTTADGTAFLENELRLAVSAVTDIAFVTILMAGLSGIGSSGASAAQVRADLAAALATISTGSQSRLFILMRAETAKGLALKADSTGSAAFPGVGPQGGLIGGVVVLVTDAVAPGDVLVVDANAIAAAGGTVAVDYSSQATIQFDSAPDSPATAATVATGLWQQNLTGIRCERYFGAQVLRAGSVALLSGVGW